MWCAALSLEFSFTDGSSWDGPYKLTMEVHDKLKGMPMTYFNEVHFTFLARAWSRDYTSIIWAAKEYLLDVQDLCSFVLEAGL